VPASFDARYSETYAEKCGQPTGVTASARVPNTSNLPVPIVQSPPARPVTEGTFRVGAGVAPPTVLSRVEPRYTDEARKAGCQGTPVLEASTWDDKLTNHCANGINRTFPRGSISPVPMW